MTIEKLGFALSVVGAFPLFVSGVMFLLHHPTVVNNMTHLGFEVRQMRPLGILKISIAILTLVPPTSFLGVILATGWMGGAMASHLRVRDPFWIQTIVPIVIWVGFGLRHEAQVRALLGV